MLIWQGWGLMALLLPFLLSIPFQSLTGSDKMSAIGWIIGGVILFNWGKQLHNPETNESILYDQDGQGYKLKKHIDTLFYIPMEYCGILWIIEAVFYLVS